MDAWLELRSLGSAVHPCPMWLLRARRVAKIADKRARPFVTIPPWEINDAKDAPWVQDLRCMTLIYTQLPSAEDIFADAHGHAKGWTTTVLYVGGSLAYPDRDMAMSCIMASVLREGCTIVDRPD